MILMDTCAIIWDALDKSKLSKKAASAIVKADKAHALYICDISIWELAMLIHARRLKIKHPSSVFTEAYLASRNIEVLSITPQIAERSRSFGKDINQDPADRIIGATSVLLQLPLVTADRNLRNSDIIETIW